MKAFFLFLLVLQFLAGEGFAGPRFIQKEYAYRYGVVASKVGDPAHLLCDQCAPPSKLVLTPTQGSDVAVNRDSVSQQARKKEASFSPTFSQKHANGAHWVDNVVKTFRFGLGSSRLSKTEEEEVAKIAQRMIRAGARNIRVKGFTCDLGSKVYNDRLALERAGTVASLLTKTGVHLSGFSGRGKCCYISKTNREANRRAEIIAEMPLAVSLP